MPHQTQCAKAAQLIDIYNELPNKGGIDVWSFAHPCFFRSLRITTTPYLVRLHPPYPQLHIPTSDAYMPFNVGKAIVVPKVPNDLAERILTEEQVIRMISVAKPCRDQVLIRLLYVSGLGVSEVEGLQWKHVHLGDGEARLTVHGKGGKTRHILLTPTVTQELEVLRGDDHNEDDAVFLSRTRKPLRKRDIRRVVAKVAEAAGLKQAVSPHWMRHAHASHALDRGAPIHLVQQDLGHANLTTTSRYVHANPADGSARYLSA